MKRSLLLLLLAVMTSVCALSMASADTTSSDTTATLTTPDSIKWMPAPGLSGAQLAVMYGDLTKAGSAYTMRLKVPDGFKIPLHWHADTERVTVVSGSVLAGGDNTDVASATLLPAGSFMVIPAKVHHWIMAKGETILQVSGTGPFAVNLVK